MHATRVFLLTFAALVILTILTVLLSLLPLGRWHLGAGLAIAFVKAALVSVVFMHLLEGTRLYAAVFIGGIGWLAMMSFLLLCDYGMRSSLNW